ncbi:MAG: 16S rRNA (guanine(527)-N(7))-methyltransferase RsmG [Rudaea sp.]
MSPSADRATLHARLTAGVAALGIAVEPATLERLLDYVELLDRWNGAYNLTAVRDTGEMIDRHIIDSLAIAKYVRGATLADVGSGAGLPGIPLAILAPARQCVLIDSNGKKARFLREAARTLNLANVKVENKRVEDVVGEFDTVTARAFSGLGEMLKMSGHLLAREGIFLAMKGSLKKEEILGLSKDYVIADDHPLVVPGADVPRRLVTVRRVTAAAHEHAA